MSYPSAILRPARIRRAALDALRPAHPYALPESTLLAFIDDLVRPPLSAAERKAVLEWLADEKMAVRTAGVLDPEAGEWVLSEKGLSLLASLI